MCVDISETTDNDVFFNYSPHVNIIDVNYHIGGWEFDAVQEYPLGSYTQIYVNDEDTLDKVIEVLTMLKGEKVKVKEQLEKDKEHDNEMKLKEKR